jgi:DNA repair protein RecO (recombination protein O)
MVAEKARALVLRTADWSETSRIATLWTREFGKVRALAKGGRRLKSSFENALDLLTVCDIVFLRKSPGSLDLLTEARVVQRFPRLRLDLAALYAAYYLAELLGEFTQDGDPHPALFDEGLAALEAFGPGADNGPRAARFELVLLRELGFSPVLEHCAACGGALPERGLTFSPAAGGAVCPDCRGKAGKGMPLSGLAWKALRDFAAPGEQWREVRQGRVRAEVRQVLGQYVTYVLGRRPRLLAYLGS